MSAKRLSIQNIILTLQHFWSERDCVILQPYDVEMGAGTFHPATFLRSLGKAHWRAAYVQPCRRPDDGRYGDNPNRLQHYYQFQVILKPAPDNIRQIYLDSLSAVNIDPSAHDIKFIEDDWESPTLGAAGLGWEIRCDGMEITQFTYFQQVGGIDCEPVCGEITYGIERLAMFNQNEDNLFDLDYGGGRTYGDLFQISEKQYSQYNYQKANIEILQRHFDDMQAECQALLDCELVLPAYDYCLKASHLFNILDARGAIGHLARPDYIQKVRKLACACARQWLAQNGG